MTTNRETMKVHVRYMIRRDMPEVLTIEAQSFEADTWTEEDFMRCLRQRNCIGNIAEHGEDVHGYTIRELGKHAVRVVNLAVNPKCRRRGVGRAMIDAIKKRLSAGKHNRIIAEIAESNLEAQLFFRAQGFRCIGVVRGGCPSNAGAEDAYRMVYALPGCEVEPIPQNRLRQYEDRT